MGNRSLDLGGITISWLDGGSFELDGGTMFGVVPKVLWSRAYPADEANYIKMTASPLLVETSDAAIVIDTGLGNKLTDKQKSIFRVTAGWNLPESIARQGLRCEDVDYVILTHCDFDHAGGIAMLDDAGRMRLTFPEARHVISKTEWYDVGQPNRRSEHNYFPVNFELLADSGKLQLIDRDCDLVPGVSIRHTGGHTRGHQAVELTGRSQCAIHMGDLMPTHAHVNPLWVMAYDNFPLDVVKKKDDTVQQYGNCWFTFYHDAFFLAGRLDSRGKISDCVPR